MHRIVCADRSRGRTLFPVAETRDETVIDVIIVNIPRLCTFTPNSTSPFVPSIFVADNIRDRIIN